jgi:hypothetical protein
MEQQGYLLTRQQASQYLGIDPKSFDRYIRPHCKCFMVGKHCRYTINTLTKYIETNLI